MRWSSSPPGIPVFKRGRGVSPASDRLEMCRLAVESNPAFDVSAIEIERGGDTYTVDTLRQLRAHYPANVELFFITGADAVASIVKWRESAAIADLAHLIAVTRPGFPLTEQTKREISEAGRFDVTYFAPRVVGVLERSAQTRGSGALDPLPDDGERALLYPGARAVPRRWEKRGVGSWSMSRIFSRMSFTRRCARS